MTSIGEQLKHALGIAKHYVVSLGKRELHIALDSPIGQALKAAVTAGEAGTTATEKMTLAVASLMPTLKLYAKDPAALESDLVTVAEKMLEDVLAQVKLTGPAAIFEALAEVV